MVHDRVLAACSRVNQAGIEAREEVNSLNYSTNRDKNGKVVGFTIARNNV